MDIPESVLPGTTLWYNLQETLIDHISKSIDYDDRELFRDDVRLKVVIRELAREHLKLIKPDSRYADISVSDHNVNSYKRSYLYVLSKEYQSLGIDKAGLNLEQYSRLTPDEQFQIRMSIKDNMLEKQSMLDDLEGSGK